MTNSEQIASALALLGIDGNKLFARICDELERGDKRAARAQLNFVDRFLAGGDAAQEQAATEKEQL